MGLCDASVVKFGGGGGTEKLKALVVYVVIFVCLGQFCLAIYIWSFMDDALD